jgi:hypothetical protein
MPSLQDLCTTGVIGVDAPLSVYYRGATQQFPEPCRGLGFHRLGSEAMSLVSSELRIAEGSKMGRHTGECLIGLHTPRKEAEQGACRLQAFGPQLTRSAAQELQENAGGRGNGVLWMVAEEYRRFYAFAITEDGIGSGWLAADSLSELRQYLPPGLVRSNIQPSETPDIIEIWVSAG